MQLSKEQDAEQVGLAWLHKLPFLLTTAAS